MRVQLSPFIKKAWQLVLDSGLLTRLRIEAVGLAQDFWKDPKPIKTPPKNAEKAAVASPESAKVKAEPVAAGSGGKARPGPPRWHADRFQVMEKIWGEGRTLPSNSDLEKMLVAPLGLNKEMNVLDLSAGLGGLARKLVADFNTYVTGLEADEVMARRGMSLSLDRGKSKKASIEHYDPAAFTATRNYDCIIARELFYHVLGKEKFFQAIAASLKPRGIMVFTDYILDKGARTNKAVAAWLEHEPTASPLSLQEMTGSWQKLRLDVRVNEDLTSMYRHEIGKRLKNFVEFLTQKPPEEDTKAYVLREIELWARRAEAMEQGLKFYRFETIRI